ncbi:proline dehydrogenase family protein [candidate division KSB1 bacterium]|nr:proline dehydrogenase family protein [candidate division KSB1 bacterium]RQW10995.1 MAG: proline dehydrogenase [candidate division KSB1 bacterium]
MKWFNSVIIIFMPLVPKPIVRIFSKKYVAGDKLDDAVRAVRELNGQHIMATLDVLGESTTDEQETHLYVEEYLRVLQIIEQEKLDCNVSLKPTQLGMLIDKELAFSNIRRIVEEAKKHANFVRIDMEDSNCTTDTIDIYERLRAEFDNVGIVLQAYMRRSVADLTKISRRPANFRLCKGIYIEPREIAYKEPSIVNMNFGFLLEKALQAGSYVGIATHDEKVVWSALRTIDQLGLKPDAYEFQMLFGVDEQLRRILVQAGHRLRVYVPYGKQWYRYVMRRLKENPQIAIYVLKALFKK